MDCALCACSAVRRTDFDPALTMQAAWLIRAILFFVGDGPAAGTRFLEMGQKEGADELHEVIVHRAQMLSELLKGVPEDAMFVDKRLVSLTEDPDKVVLHFADGSTADADIIVGADGTHGVVRGLVLGQDHPATAPVFSGFWDARNLLPYEEAQRIFGPEYINVKESRQHDWIGSSGFFHPRCNRRWKISGFRVRRNDRRILAVFGMETAPDAR